MAKKSKTRKDPNSMSFLDHLEDLRWHLLRATLAILIAGAIAFGMKSFIFDVIIFGPKKADFYTYNLLCNISEYFNLQESLF